MESKFIEFESLYGAFIINVTHLSLVTYGERDLAYITISMYGNLQDIFFEAKEKRDIVLQKIKDIARLK